MEPFLILGLPVVIKKTESKKATSRRRILIRLCLLIGGLGIGVGFGEVLARWFQVAPAVQAIDVQDPNSPYQRSDNPILRYELRPGYSAPLAAQHQYIRMSDVEFQQQVSSAVTGTVTVNSHGLRDIERQTQRQSSGQRILLVGDSVVEMVNYVSDEFTISRLLESKFGDGTEVLNVGTAGYCTRAEVELIRDRGIAFKPDLVVLLFVENDYWGYNLEHALGGANIKRPAIANHLFVASDLFRGLSLKLNLFGFADEQDPAKWHRSAVGDNNVVSGFELLKSLADQHDFNVVVAFWPSFFKEGIGYRYLLEGTHELVAEPLAWKFGFPTVRLDQYFLQHWATLDPQPQPEWFYTCGDGMHPSLAGCDLAADAIMSVLRSGDDSPLIQPDGIMDIDRKFEAAARVAEMLALEPEEKVPLAEQIAMTMKRQNRFVDAGEFLTKATDKSPGELSTVLANGSEAWRSYFAAGEKFLNTNQDFAARDLFERVASLRPKHVESRMHLARLMMKSNQMAQAKRWLEDVLSIEADNAEALRLLRGLSD